MRVIFTLALFCVFGCSGTRLPTPRATQSSQNVQSATLHILVHVDGASLNTAHPLVCGTGRDFPAGREFAFTDFQSQAFVHAVFPENVMPPNELNGKLLLHGRYQAIQNRDHYKFMKPSESYQYFVVSSWEYKK
jgi:hypothetical protein